MDWNALREKIERMRSKKLSEADTKRALIEPILAFLGWDTSDVIEVRNEYRKEPSDNPVDYAMFGGPKPNLFIEAKSLDAGIEERKSTCQALAYANACGVEWVVLTDGDNWRIYNAHAPVDASEKEFRRISISENRNIDALQLISKAGIAGPGLKQTWDFEYNGKRVTTALQALLSQADHGLVKLLRKADPTLDPAALKSILPAVELHLQKPDQAPAKPLAPIKPNNASASNNATPPKTIAPPTTLRIEVGGEIIHKPKGIDSFTDALEQLGLEKISNLKVSFGNDPLVGKQQPHQRFKKINDWFILRNFSNLDKKQILEKLAKELGIPIKIELVLKS